MERGGREGEREKGRDSERERERGRETEGGRERVIFNGLEHMKSGVKPI